jgi:hypothetical protein
MNQQLSKPDVGKIINVDLILDWQRHPYRQKHQLLRRGKLKAHSQSWLLLPLATGKILEIKP